MSPNGHFRRPKARHLWVRASRENRQCTVPKQNGESSDLLPSGRGLAALLAAGVPDGRGETWPCTRPHRRRRPARTRPCIPHAPKTLRNRALPIFGEVPAACTIFARTQRLVVRVKMTGFWTAKSHISRPSLLLVNRNTKKKPLQSGASAIKLVNR